VADLRDPWSIHPRKRLERPRAIQAWTSRIESRLFGDAKRVVLNMDLCRDAYRDHYAGSIEADRFTSIRNAFDPVLYPPTDPRPSQNPRFEIHYFGGLGASREPEAFYRGLYDFIHKHALAPDALRLVFHAESEPLEDPLVHELGLVRYIEMRKRRPIESAFPELHNADVLLLIEGPKRELQLPAKLYDYMAAGAPILGIGLGPELRRVVDGLEGSLTTGYEDGAGLVSRHLRTLYARRAAPVRPSATDLEPYTAPAQAERIAAVLDDAIA
jgi:hypothetical protein